MHVPLLILLPFLVFVKHHGYGLLRPEIGICVTVLALVGLTLWLSSRRSPVLNAVITASLVALVIDVQTDLFGGLDQKFLLAVGGLTALAVPVRKHLSTIATVVASVMCVVTLVAPAAPMWRENFTEVSPSSSASALPLLLHIVLDEQIGIEGIPREFDPEGAVAGQLRAFYVDRGFEVAGRAYSEYYDTQNSLANLLNFDSSVDPGRYFPGGFSEGWSLDENAYFQKLASRGYRLHVYQTDYMNFCGHPDRDRIVSCLTYELETLQAVRDAALAIADKVRIVATMYLRLSAVVSDSRSSYAHLHAKLGARGWSLPAWPAAEGRVSSLAVPSVVERLRRDLEVADRGDAYFVHIMLPHYPFVYDEDCRIRRSASDWLSGSDDAAYPARNTDAGRAIRYRQYLQQTLCVTELLKKVFAVIDHSSVGREGLIIVHGDHGSRLNTTYPVVKFATDLSPSDVVDSYSTLFAARVPGREGGYRRDPTSLQRLLIGSLRGIAGDGNDASSKEPAVFLVDYLTSMKEWPMAPFADGRPVDRW